MALKFANVYTFLNPKTGNYFTARWDTLDGAQTTYTGPSPDYNFVSVELNVPDGERSEAAAAEMGNATVQLPDFIAKQRVLITVIR